MKLRNRLQAVKTIKELMEGSEREARRDGADLPSAEHLLLSALDLKDGSAARSFARAGIDPADVRPAIAGVHEDALRGAGVDPLPDDLLSDTEPAPQRGPFRMTASGQAAFHTASTIARGEHGGRLRGAHVLLGVLQMDHGTAIRALRRLGVDLDALAAAAQAEAAGVSGPL